MSEQQNDAPITPHSGVRITVGLVASVVLACAYILYERDEYFASRAETQQQTHIREVRQEIKNIVETLKGKADRSEVSDRFKGSDFRTYTANKKIEDEQFREFVRLQFTLTEKRNEVEHKSLEKRIEHLDDDLNSAVERIDNHYNMRVDK